MSAWGQRRGGVSGRGPGEDQGRTGQGSTSLNGRSEGGVAAVHPQLQQSLTTWARGEHGGKKVRLHSTLN